MTDPIQSIVNAGRRLARIAAGRMALQGLPPALTALAGAFLLEKFCAVTWGRSGQVLDPAVAGGMRIGLLAAGIAGIGVAAFMAYRSYRKAGNLSTAAEEIDRVVGANQEIVTLAELASAQESAQDSSAQSPLLPILRRRATDYLANFDPATTFRLEPTQPIVRSSLAILGIMIVVALATLAMVHPPSPYSKEAQQLRAIAENLQQSSPELPQMNVLADRLRDAADALENSKLPPEKQLETLAAIEQLIPPEKKKDQKKPEKQRNEETGKNKAKNSKTPGKGQGKSNGGGGSGGQNQAGNQQGQNGKGSGSNQASGQGSGAGNSGSGSKQNQQHAQNANAGGNNSDNDKGKNQQDQMAKLRQELKQTQSKLENSQLKPDQSRDGDQARTKRRGAGKDPNKAGGQMTARKERQGAGNLPTKGHANTPNIPEKKGVKTSGNPGGSAGDTHLGEFPAARRYERFYKPGEGPPGEVKDARYVLFRIVPTEASGGGKIAHDKIRPTASTPYSNLPLKEEKLTAAPDERQMIPPRYRDLIR